MKQTAVFVQTSLSLLALGISVFAAFFSWRQVDDARMHNRLSVAPLLHVVSYAEGPGGRNGFYVANVGLGPAILKEFSARSGNFVANGFEVDQWTDVLSAADMNSFCFSSGWPRYESAVKAGEERPLFQITQAHGNGTCYAEMVKLIGGRGIDLIVRYESMYGESKTMSEGSKLNSKSIQLLYQSLFGSSH